MGDFFTHLEKIPYGEPEDVKKMEFAGEVSIELQQMLREGLVETFESSEGTKYILTQKGKEERDKLLQDRNNLDIYNKIRKKTK